MEETKLCGNCKKDFKFSEVKLNYPEICHPELKKVWHNSEIEFYCSYCYLLKVIKQMEIIRNKENIKNN